MANGEGKKIWIFPDGDLPEKNEKSRFEAHEALMGLNTSNRDAHLQLSFYFSDKDPIEGIAQSVKAKRVKCIRMDHPDEIGGVQLPYRTQYALRVESDVEIVATFGRLDTASGEMAFYSAAWYNR
jgi:hypothetical protein